MKLTSTITDNVGELLARILEFTQRRRRVLTMNVANVHTPEYVPCDLDVEGFAAVMARAVAEHMEHDRLVFCDNENIRFGPRGFFESTPVVDEQAKRLLANDPRAYLEKQISKLAENMVNHKVVTQLLLRQKQCATEAINSGGGSGCDEIIPHSR